jgi:hypothetical protein
VTVAGQPARRRVFVADFEELGLLASKVAQWTDRLGYARAADPEEADAEVRAAHVEPRPENGAWLALTPRRLAPEAAEALRGRGAAVVLDGHQGLLDLAYALAEHLFAQRAEQRRHGLSFGRLEVGVRSRTGASGRGRLVGLHRCGAWIDAPGVALGVGALVELDIEVEDRVAHLKGRVVCARARGTQGEPLLALELALDQGAELRSFRQLARAGSRPEPSPA